MRMSEIGTSTTTPVTSYAADLPDAAEGDDAEGGERREAGDGRGGDVEDVDRRGGREARLAQELDQVGDRLEEPERPGPVRPVAKLHAAEELPLDEVR